MDDRTTKPVWEQLFVKITEDPLKQIRDAAGKWTGILSALVGVSTILGLVQGRDAFSKLGLVTQILFVCVFILVLITAILAVYLAALASEGVPTGKIVRDQTYFTQWYRNATNRAASFFRLSQRLALVTVILLALELGITWYGPGATGTESFLVVQKSGSLACGTLQRDAKGNLLLSSGNQEPPVLLKNVISVTPVSNCP